MNQSEWCNPMKYSVYYEGGFQLPQFVLFDENKLTLHIQTNKASDEQIYQIIMKGTTNFFHANLSNIISNFNLIVKCVPKKFSASNNPEFSRYLYLDELDPLQVEYKPFDIKPDCINRARVIYSASQRNGSPLPPYV